MVPFSPRREASTLLETVAKTSDWVAACGSTQSNEKLVHPVSPVRKLRLLSDVGRRQGACERSDDVAGRGLKRTIVL